MSWEVLSLQSFQDCTTMQLCYHRILDFLSRGDNLEFSAAEMAAR
jgi:hypothetical protein